MEGHASDRIVQVPKGLWLRERLGRVVRDTPWQRFLMTRLMELWLDLIGAFQPNLRLRGATD